MSFHFKWQTPPSGSCPAPSQSPAGTATAAHLPAALRQTQTANSPRFVFLTRAPVPSWQPPNVHNPRKASSKCKRTNQHVTLFQPRASAVQKGEQRCPSGERPRGRMQRRQRRRSAASSAAGLLFVLSQTLQPLSYTSVDEVMQGSKLSHMLKGREKVAGFDTAAHTAACPIKYIYKRLYTWSSYWYGHTHSRSYSMTYRIANTTLQQARFPRYNCRPASPLSRVTCSNATQLIYLQCKLSSHEFEV